MAKFFEMALEAIGRGLVVIPLEPKSKAAIEANWQEKGYDTPDEIAKLADQNPDYNCGVLCSKDSTWILDIDHTGWFADTFPSDLRDTLKTFAVLTGGGGWQYHFLQNDLSRSRLSNKSIKNPDKIKYTRSDGTLRPTVADILFDRKQGLYAGSIHPNGKEYKIASPLPLVCADELLITWICRQLEKSQVSQGTVAATASPFRTMPGVDVEAMFVAAGLKFDRFEGDGKIHFNYHEKMGKCLVRGKSHEPANPRQSAFTWDPKQGQLYHSCFSASCEPGIKNTKYALAQLGIDWKKIFVTDGITNYEAVSLDTVKEVVQEYLWPEYLPVNTLVLFSGASSEGKSPVTLDLISRVSNGSNWPDGSINTHGPRKCLLLSAEDDMASVIIPRLRVMEANISNIYMARATVTKNLEDIEKAVTLDTDLPEMRDMMRSIQGLSLVVIDPITNYLGRVKMNAEDEVRTILMPLATIAHELNVCIAMVGHINKREKGTSPLDRVMGARAFAGVSRKVFMFGPDPDGDDKFQHIMAPGRGAAIPTLKYYTEAVDRTIEGKTVKVVRVVWNGVSEATTEDAVDPVSNKDKTEIKEAAKCLRDFLKPGQKSIEEVYQHCGEQGYMLQPTGGGPGLNTSRLRRKAGVLTKKESKKSYWYIPAAKAEAEQDDIRF